jgi:glycerol-3-phosphate dehydrogenase subunit C
MARTIPLNDPDFYNQEKAEKELRRLFDICHGCRRCFNLCGLFPKLFDRLDSDEVDGDVEKLTAKDIADILPSCTLCDMCYMVKCPYVPPHPWNVDFPRAILRYKAIMSKKNKSYKGFVDHRLAHVDQYLPLATTCSSVGNAVMKCGPLRHVAEYVTGIDRGADLPEFRSKALKKTWVSPEPNPQGHAYGQEVWFYLTCLSNYYESVTAEAAARVLAHWGVRVHGIYPGCCGMPLLEQGHLDDVISRARAVAPALAGLGTVVALTPSCTLMLKSEWPALLPDDGCVRDLADRTTDLMRYISDVAALSSKPIRMSLPEDISMHMACHVRAQNQGNASYELLSKLSASPITLIERCSGHGGMWGYKKEHFQEALAVGKPVIRQAASVGARIVTSECPMAAKHLQQQARLMGHRDVWVIHPVVLLAMAVDPSFFKAGETFVPAPSFSIGEPVHG